MTTPTSSASQPFRVSITKMHDQEGQLVFRLRLRRVQQPRCILELAARLLRETDRSIGKTEYSDGSIFIFTKKKINAQHSRQQLLANMRQQLEPLIDTASVWVMDHPKTKPSQSNVTWMVRNLTKPRRSTAPAHLLDPADPARKDQQHKRDRIAAKRQRSSSRRSAIKQHSRSLDNTPVVEIIPTYYPATFLVNA